MAKLRVFVLLLACVHIASATNDVPEADDATLLTWMGEVLEGVDYLAPSQAATRLLTFGKRSFPILTGETDLDALVAVAELGQGRIVAIGGEEFVSASYGPYAGCQKASDVKGLEYTGKLAFTKSNRHCQDWRTQSPHTHTFNFLDLFPDTEMRNVASHCRNPNKHKRGLWCFTQEPDKTLEKCNVVLCNSRDEIQVMRFVKNAVKWLAQTEILEESVCYIYAPKDMACLDSSITKVAIVDPTLIPSTPDYDARMANWVKTGGGLLYGLDILRYTDDSWNEALFYSVLKEAGIIYVNARSKGASPTPDIYPITPGVEPPQVYPVDTTANKALQLHLLSLPYAVKHIVEISDLDYPPVYISDVIENTCKFKAKPWTMETRKAIMSHFVDFVHKKESELTWPECDYFSVYTPDLGQGVRYMFKLIPCLGFLGLWKTVKAPNVDKCPGELRQISAPRFTATVKIESSNPDFIATEYYVPAGGELVATVLTPNPSWRYALLYVGVHTDDLLDTPPYRRPPIMAMAFAMNNKTMRIHTPWGGTVGFKGEKNMDTYMRVSLSGVVRAPYYKLGVDSLSSWNMKKHYPAPWGVLSGHRMTFILLSEHLQFVHDPKPILEEWDRVIIASYQLAGIPEYKWTRESFSTDIELQRGVAHSGYPIKSLMLGYGYPMGYKWPLDLNNLKNTWGFYHEIGHNMQMKYWTFENYNEVTNNIFTLFNMEDAGKVDPMTANDGWYENLINNRRFATLINSGSFDLTATGTRNREMLIIYTQLYRQFGWRCYREVFRSYENDIELNRNLPGTQQARINSWIERWSKKTGYNLCPLFQFWQYPVTICNNLANLPAFLPTDDITEHPDVKAMADKVAASYPGILRTLPSKPACYSMTYAHRQQIISEILKNNRFDYKEKYNPPLHKWGKMSKIFTGYQSKEN